MKEKNPIIIASNLKRKIADKGITRKEICEKSGISPGTLSAWLNCRHTPEDGSLYVMANVLECRVEELLTPYVPAINGKMDDQTIEQWRARALTAEQKVNEMEQRLFELRDLMNEGIKICTRG